MSEQTYENLARDLDSHFAEWRRELSYLEVAELRSYQGIGYMRINSVLRDEVPASSYDEDTLLRLEQTIATLDGAIEKGVLGSDLTVYRGLRDPVAVFGVPDITMLTAQVVNEPAYSSTSLDPELAVRMTVTAPAPVLVEIHLAAGQRAAWLGLAGSASRRREYEVLLPRRLQIKIDNVDTTSGVPSIEGCVVL